jgi:hypothetical protein
VDIAFAYIFMNCICGDEHARRRTVRLGINKLVVVRDARQQRCACLDLIFMRNALVRERRLELHAVCPRPRQRILQGERERRASGRRCRGILLPPKRAGCEAEKQ